MRVDNSIGIRNLCAVALHLRQTMPKNSATNFAIRTVLREAINKSNPGYKGNINRRNCAYLSLAAEALLAANGISMHSNSKETADKHVPWGMRCTETPAGLKVNRVTRASVAASAGISANDVIVALDGIKADSKQLALLSNVERDIECHLFRRDELMRVNVLPKTADEAIDKASPHKVSLHLAKANQSSGVSDNSSPVDAGWQAWLNAIERYQS